MDFLVRCSPLGFVSSVVSELHRFGYVTWHRFSQTICTEAADLYAMSRTVTLSVLCAVGKRRAD